jgi:hypothetical protein
MRGRYTSRPSRPSAHLPKNAELAAGQLEAESVSDLEDWSAVDDFCRGLPERFGAEA